MKLIAVCRKKWKHYPGDICHQVRKLQFDGLARRGDYEDHMAPPVAYWSEDRTPLTCSRHGRFVPPIFIAHCSWIISEKVKNALPDSIPCEFLPVNFEKLADFPLIGEEVEYWDPPAFVDDPPDLINNYPDVPAFHQKVGPYYEWLAPIARTLTEEFQDIDHIDIVIDEMNHKEDVPLSQEMLLKYPVVKSGSFLFFTPFLFDIISPFLDWTYFVKTELEI